MKHLFYLFILLVFSACGSSEDNDTGNPTLPGPLQTGRQVSKIVINYPGDDAPAHDVSIEFRYDADGRVSKMDMTYTVPNEDIEQSGNFDFSYEGNNVQCVAFYDYGDEYSMEKMELNGVLNDQSRLVLGSVKDYVLVGDSFVEEASESIYYQVAYDELGYMSSTTCFYDVDQEGVAAREVFNQLIWENGNLTELKWGTTGDNYMIFDCAEYGNVQNKANLDLSWLLLTTEGWSFMVGDPSNLFGIAGYYGNRSRMMPVKIYYTQSNSDTVNSYTQITYQLDNEGYIVGIIEKFVRTNDVALETTYTISYKN